MDYSIAATIVISLAGIAATYAVCLRILASKFAAAVVVLPLALTIPWAKHFPAVGDALTLFASVGTLYFWLSAQARPARSRVAFIGVLVMVALRPETLILALAAILYHGLRYSGLFSWRDVARACVLAVAVAFSSSIIVNPYDISVVISGLIGRLANCVAWNGMNWIFAGTNIDTSLRTAKSYGVTFYVPLVVVFSALAYGWRRTWWFMPVSIWTACVLVQTLHAAQPPVLRGCPPLLAAFLILFGSAGVLSLRKEFPSVSRVLGPARRAEADQ